LSVPYFWYEQKKWRSPAWHVRNEFGHDGFLYLTYNREYDDIGADTGAGHIGFIECWPSCGIGESSVSMPEAEALKAFAEIEKELDEKYKRVDMRQVDERDISRDFRDTPPLSQHPHFAPTPRRQVSAMGASLDRRTWRTSAYAASTSHGTEYTAFCEFHPHPDPKKDGDGMYELIRWRISKDSVAQVREERSIIGVMDFIKNFEREYRNCPPASTNKTGILALPAEYFDALPYKLHPYLNSQDQTTIRRLKAPKVFKLKPK
jgi:hypothetical protein